MATPTSPEASDIRRRGRQRLIGAAVIAILLVVFVPMVLDSEPKTPRSAPALDIPAKDKVAALPAPGPSPAAPAVAPAPAPPAPEPKVEPPKAAPVIPAQAGTQSPPSRAPETTPKLEGFAVQVGAFREEDKLKQARDKLAAAGISHFVERRETPTGPLNRLRAGPYPTREAAEQALEKVKSASLEGQVVPLP